VKRRRARRDRHTTSAAVRHRGFVQKPAGDAGDRE
jgi:hypothetical protein